MVFWTIALGLGGLSLVTVTALSAADANSQVRFTTDYAPMPPTAIEPMPGNAVPSDGILVRLQESPEAEDVNGAASAVSPALDVIEAGP